VSYKTINTDNAGKNNAALETNDIVEKGRAYHSAYFEMLGEQGYPGLGLWLTLHLWGCGRWKVRARWTKGGPQEDLPDAQWIGPLANALQQGQLVYMVGGSFVGIAFQPFMYMLIGLQIGLRAYAMRIDPSREAFRPLRPVNAQARAATQAGPGQPRWPPHDERAQYKHAERTRTAPSRRSDRPARDSRVAGGPLPYPLVAGVHTAPRRHRGPGARLSGGGSVLRPVRLRHVVQLCRSTGVGRARAAARFLWRRMAQIWPLHLLILGGFVLFRAALTVPAPRGGATTGRIAAAGAADPELGLYPRTGLEPPGLVDQHRIRRLSGVSRDRRGGPADHGPPSPGDRDRGVAAGGRICAVHAPGLRTLGADIPTMGLWRCLVGFMLGTLACVIWQAARSPRAWPWALFAAGWIALGSVAGWPETAIVPPAIVTAMLALTYAKGPLARFLSSRAAVWLGEVSYSTYLAHAFLFLVFKLLFVDASLQIGWAGLAAYLLLLLIASWTLYRLIEKPAQRWLNARTPGWTRPLPASPAE
jgi:hypothetical protein